MLGFFSRASLPVLERYAFRAHSTTCADRNVSGTSVSPPVAASGLSPDDKLFAAAKYGHGGGAIPTDSLACNAMTLGEIRVGVFMTPNVRAEAGSAAGRLGPD